MGLSDFWLPELEGKAALSAIPQITPISAEVIGGTGKGSKNRFKLRNPVHKVARFGLKISPKNYELEDHSLDVETFYTVW